MEIVAKVRPQPAKKGADGKEIPAVKGGDAKANYNMPVDVKGMLAAWGEDVVYAAARGSVVISIQAAMRRGIETGKSAADIQKLVSEFKPDVRTIVKQSAFEKASGAIGKLSAEERAALLKQLQGMK